MSAAGVARRTGFGQAWLIAAALCFLPLADGQGVEPGEMLADPALEARAREISSELRCVVCQNQSIDDSNADLAHDLRVLVRERLVAGDSDEQAVQFIVDRYGDFVLLRPPLKPETYVLWAAPALFLLVGAAIGAAYVRRRRRIPAEVLLTDDELRRLDALLKTDKES